MPVLAECNVGNVCRSRRASNAAGEEQRANLSTPRLGHQTGRNQAARRVEGGVGGKWGGGRGGRKVVAAVAVAEAERGGSFPFDVACTSTPPPPSSSPSCRRSLPKRVRPGRAGPVRAGPGPVELEQRATALAQR